MATHLNKLNCERCRRKVTPVQKMAGRICPLCRIILEPLTIAEVTMDPDPNPIKEVTDIGD